MAELADIEYNRSVPNMWFQHGTQWLPKRWAYGAGPNGSTIGSSTYGYDAQGNPLNYDTLSTNNAYCLTKYFKSQGWSFEAIMGMCGNMHKESDYQPGYWENLQTGNTSLGFGLVQWTGANQYIIPARQIWTVNDPFAPYFYNGWYECYMIASEVFAVYRDQWVEHQAGAGHNPVNLATQIPPDEQPDPPYYNGEYPGERLGVPPPAYDFRLSFKQYAEGVIYDQTAPHSTPYERINYLTEAFYWDYEQVGDWPMHGSGGADRTLEARKTEARTMYDRLLPYFGNFSHGNIETPTVIGPDFTIKDLDPKPQSNLIYYLRPWWQRIGR